MADFRRGVVYIYVKPRVMMMMTILWLRYKKVIHFRLCKVTSIYYISLYKNLLLMKSFSQAAQQQQQQQLVVKSVHLNAAGGSIGHCQRS